MSILNIFEQLSLKIILETMIAYSVVGFLTFWLQKKLTLETLKM